MKVIMPPWATYDERNSRTHLIQCTLAIVSVLPERKAVVGRQDDKCLLRNAKTIELIKNVAHSCIQLRNRCTIAKPKSDAGLGVHRSSSKEGEYSPDQEQETEDAPGVCQASADR
ncbi:Hypothetical Protein FCC1311_009292 [Hondaea fermentalgiana]|uniref:Uncharacterized protein n=1 Tax=Hondaea fermentalgiana TaxID=2315210 RepID=A0A2R5G9G9_9STRA|nr:Hypothetical Protein FCC1311_009292 [Hondaea fermentalgiana]|eukprot:GBG24711.1 Hypothetical Protein FCC1311_009292 [Hondaea fermentalgiana]